MQEQTLVKRGPKLFRQSKSPFSFDLTVHDCQFLWSKCHDRRRSVCPALHMFDACAQCVSLEAYFARRHANMDTPDLQTILSNLARLSTPTQQTDSPFNNEGNAVTPVPPNHGGSESVPRNLADRTDDPRLRPQSRSAATGSPKPVIDPATITSWQEGLRCVTKIAARNSQFAAGIRKVTRRSTNKALEPANKGHR